jgi:hypothetical protein
MLRWLTIAAGVVLASWALMIVAARRLPPQALIEARPADRRILERLAPATAMPTNHWPTSVEVMIQR